ncbi:killer cell lectin-like receptor subfamily B member 1B allele B isoform X1 [Ambystoma mexicanum]|uniref:killer cell lectin-like receptor subfamily B member 1B allele B isoform X1 n=1 Tax=Ambystoma mexicanum TaxID=8296 RepID=UPI0037E74384
MAGDVVYADVKGGALHTGPHPKAARRSKESQCPRWHQGFLWLTGSLHVLEVLAFIGLGVWAAFRPHQEKHEIRRLCGNGCDSNMSGRDKSCPLFLENTQRMVQRYPFQCEPKQQVTSGCPFPAASTPTVIDNQWELHAGKCYHFSARAENWSQSNEDCASRGSRLLLVHDKEERDFIGSKINDKAWIGLFSTTPGKLWTWVNGSTFKAKSWLKEPDQSENGCGTVASYTIGSANCSTRLPWVCKKEALKT